MISKPSDLELAISGESVVSVPSQCSSIEINQTAVQLGAAWNEDVIHEIIIDNINDTPKSTVVEKEDSLTEKEDSLTTASATETKTVKGSTKHRNTPRIIMTLFVLFLNALYFIDGYYIFENVDYIKDLLKATLGVMGFHLLIEHFLENIIYSLKPNAMILYSTTACIRDIINNMIMTLIYFFDDYGYWWKSIMWGCYMADLVMLLSKWNYFKSNWRKFVFAHHFGVGMMILVLNHTTKILTDAALLCLIMFMNSNSPGCASPIWKAFKLPFYKQSTIICFVVQRILRVAAFALAGRVKLSHFFGEYYGYVVLVVFAAVLEIWDVYCQIGSIWKYYKKQKKQTIKMLEADL